MKSSALLKAMVPSAYTKVKRSAVDCSTYAARNRRSSTSISSAGAMVMNRRLQKICCSSVTSPETCFNTQYTGAPRYESSGAFDG